MNAIFVLRKKNNMMEMNMKDFRVKISDVYYPQMSNENFIQNFKHDKFCKLCYDAYVKNGEKTDNTSLVDFALHIHSAFEIAWGLLIDGNYKPDWGVKFIGSENYLVSPTYPEGSTESWLFIAPEGREIMFPILWLILKRIDIHDGNVTYCEEVNSIRMALCYQIKKLLIDNKSNLSFFKELIKTFEIHDNPSAILPIEKEAGIRSIEHVMFGVSKQSCKKTRKYTEATDEEVNGAIQQIASYITVCRHWNGVIEILCKIPSFLKRIDDKYPHKGGQHETRIKKFVVTEIEEQAKRVDIRWEKIYNHVKSLTEPYPKVQEQFRSILEEILTT